MSVASLCPDSLIARARSGALSPEEQATFEAHLQSCRSCRVSWRIGRDFDHALTPRPGDDRLTSRLAALAVATARRPRSWRGRLLRAGAFVSILLACSAGAAMVSPTVRASLVRIWSRTPAPPPVPAPPPPVPAPPPPAPAPPAPVIEPPQAEEPVVAPPKAKVHRHVAAVAEVSPAALFADANANRRQDREARALELYQELESRYPTSTEAVVSQVSLGRMLLERSHQPSRAVQHFDRYLSQHAHTALVEEALFGRATALMQLGRATEERDTWQQLLDRFPNSVYAPRARSRLGERR